MTSMIQGEKNQNDNLVNRLHGIIRPFILRRLKKDVETQLPGKFEHVVKCPLSRRQVSTSLGFLFTYFPARITIRYKFSYIFSFLRWRCSSMKNSWHGHQPDKQWRKEVISWEWWMFSCLFVKVSTRCTRFYFTPIFSLQILLHVYYLTATLRLFLFLRWIVCNHPDLFEPRSIITPLVLPRIVIELPSALVGMTESTHCLDEVCKSTLSPLWCGSEGISSTRTALRHSVLESSELLKLEREPQFIEEEKCKSISVVCFFMSNLTSSIEENKKNLSVVTSKAPSIPSGAGQLRFLTVRDSSHCWQSNATHSVTWMILSILHCIFWLCKIAARKIKRCTGTNEKVCDLRSLSQCPLTFIKY